MRQYTKEWLQELCQNSYSLSEVLNKAGRKQGGGAQQTLKKKIVEWEIDISHFTGQRWHKSPNQMPQQKKEKYLTYYDGKAAERAVEMIFGGTKDAE